MIYIYIYVRTFYHFFCINTLLTCVHFKCTYIYIDETNEMYDSNTSWHLTFLDSSTTIRCFRNTCHWRAVFCPAMEACPPSMVPSNYRIGVLYSNQTFCCQASSVSVLMTIIGTLVYVWVMNHGTYWKDPLSDRGVSVFMWNGDINNCVSEGFWLLEGLGRLPLLNKLKRQRKTQFNAGEAFRLQITCFARPRIVHIILHRYIFSTCIHAHKHMYILSYYV